MRLAARGLGRRQRLAASIAALAAMVVVVLFTYGEIMSAPNKHVQLVFCSHPGASRDFDGGLLDNDALSGDIISIHPTVPGQTQGAINEGGTQSNHGWASYIYWRSMVHVDDAEIDALTSNQTIDANTEVPCTLYAQFRINGRVAVSQLGPCVPVDLNGDGNGDGRVDMDANNRPLVSVRVWLNNTRNPDHENIPCDSSINYELPGQTEPVPFQRPPGLITPVSGGNGGSVSTPVNDDTDDGEDGTDDIDDIDESNGDTPVEDNTNNGETSTDEEDDTDNGDKPTEEDQDSQGTSDAVNGTTSEDENGQSDAEVTQTDDSDDLTQQDDDQEQDQSVSEQSTSVKESDDEVDLLQSEDQSQAEDAQDLMEQEERADSEADAEQAEFKDEETQDTEQVQTRPRAPSTGTGGLIESQRETRWRLVMVVSMGAAALIAAILIGLNRRNSRSIE